MKFNAQDVSRELNYFDPGCLECFVGSGSEKNSIYFLYDEDDKSPWLKAKFYKEYVKFTGFQLSTEEKKLVFPYCDFDNIGAFTENLVEFAVDYFNSIKKEYKRK